jgi:hypothetical protein
MKKDIKEKINSLDPIVREKLLKRLAAERLAKKHNLEIESIYDSLELQKFNFSGKSFSKSLCRN